MGSPTQGQTKQGGGPSFNSGSGTVDYSLHGQPVNTMDQGPGQKEMHGQPQQGYDLMGAPTVPGGGTQQMYGQPQQMGQNMGAQGQQMQGYGQAMQHANAGNMGKAKQSYEQGGGTWNKDMSQHMRGGGYQGGQPMPQRGGGLLSPGCGAPQQSKVPYQGSNSPVLHTQDMGYF